MCFPLFLFLSHTFRRGKSKAKKKNTETQRMAAARKEEEPLSAEALQARVYQGLQQRKKCSLCLQTFYVDELPGAITYKSILELRQKWGEDIRKSNKLPSPSQLYKREELCIFCMQFFDVDGMVDAPPAAAAASAAGSKNGTKRNFSPNATHQSSQLGGTNGSKASSPTRKAK